MYTVPSPSSWVREIPGCWTSQKSLHQGPKMLDKMLTFVCRESSPVGFLRGQPVFDWSESWNWLSRLLASSSPLEISLGELLVHCYISERGGRKGGGGEGEGGGGGEGGWGRKRGERWYQQVQLILFLSPHFNEYFEKNLAVWLCCFDFTFPDTKHREKMHNYLYKSRVMFQVIKTI